jgi:dienelactone hydrolase
MRTVFRIVLVVSILASGSLIAAPTYAASVAPAPPGPRVTRPALLPIPGPCAEGTLPSGGLSLVCVPAAGWNGDLIVYAHGYVAFNEPLNFYNLTLPDGTYVPDLVQSLGFAFATTSYRRNGLAILEGVADVRELVDKFVADVGQPGKAYITGPSEGGAVSVLSAERSGDVFDAGLALCGPIGNFRKQINYWGDFRALYDVFFPGTLPGDAMNVPSELIRDWEGTYQPVVLAKLAADPLAAAQLIRTSHAPIDPADPTTAGATTAGILWYNVFATEDGKQQLGGTPFDNTTRVYRGSLNDAALNAAVDRFAAEPAALAAMQQYETTGNPAIPLVTMHTTGDPIIPYWHQTQYRQKALANGNTDVTQLRIARYGHCAFTTTEVLAGFGLMVLKATGQSMFVPDRYDVAGVRALEQSGE